MINHPCEINVDFLEFLGIGLVNFYGNSDMEFIEIPSFTFNNYVEVLGIKTSPSFFLQFMGILTNSSPFCCC